MGTKDKLKMPKGKPKPKALSAAAQQRLAFRAPARVEDEDHEWPKTLKPWHVKFCNALSFRPVFSFACRSCRVSWDSATKSMEAYPDFKAAVGIATKLGVGRLEESAFERATDGLPSAIFDRDGRVIGVEMKYSDKLAEVMLKAHRPEVYDRDSINQQNGANLLDASLQKALESGALKMAATRFLNLPAPVTVDV